MDFIIVGVVSSKDEADEFQDIAKVLVLERRIKEISSHSRKPVIEKPVVEVESARLTNSSSRLAHSTIFSQVRGLI